MKKQIGLSTGVQRRSKALLPFAFLLLAAALALTTYIIWQLIPGVINSDYTDTMLWAQATVDSGRVLDPDFAYAALLPFGANIWLVPMIKLWGYSLNVYLWGMTVFMIVLVLSLISYFRSLGWTLSSALIVTAFSLCLFSGSEKLREIFWGHVIYYSLGVVFLLLGLSLLNRIVRGGRRQTLQLILLLILSILVATDGLQMAALFALPLMMAIAFRLLAQTSQEALMLRAGQLLTPLVTILLGTAAGLALLTFLKRGGVNAGYANAYSNWSESKHWAENLDKFVPEYFKLFGAWTEKNIPIFGINSVLLLFVVLACLMSLLIPLLACLLPRLRNGQSEGLKLTLAAHLSQMAILVFFYIFGMLGAANWRMTPLLAMGLISTLAFLVEALTGTKSSGELLKVSESCAVRAVTVNVISGDGQKEDSQTRGNTDTSDQPADEDERPLTLTCDQLPVKTGPGTEIASECTGGDVRTAAVAWTRWLSPGVKAAATGLLLLAFAALASAVNILRVDTREPVNQKLQNTLSYVQSLGMKQGYATFWNAAAMTLLADERPLVRNIEANDKGLGLPYYQNRRLWYEQDKDNGRCFLILSDGELADLKKTQDWTLLQSKLVSEDRQHDFNILILKENIFDLLTN